MTGLHPNDEAAQKITLALEAGDAGAVAAALPPAWSTPTARTLSLYSTRLLPFFEAARAEHLSLRHPPAPDEFHPWVLRVAQAGAKPNTARARIAALNTLYERLMDLGLKETNPLRGLARPEEVAVAGGGPTPAEIRRLLAHAQVRGEEPSALPAALSLIYHHAFKVSELLALTWADYDHPSGRVFRGRGATTLDRPARQAMDAWQARHGGTLAQGRVFPWPGHLELGREIFRATTRASTPMIRPRDLRRASLRDFPHTPDSAGFAGPQRLERATRLARAVAEGLSPED